MHVDGDMISEERHKVDKVSEREEWLAWRRQGITATDVARAATGMYGGAVGVFFEKTSDTQQPVTAAMERGLRMEPILTEAASTLIGRPIVGSQTTFESAENSRWRCTVDGLVPDGNDAYAAIVELKTYSGDPVFDYWKIQIGWQMHVSAIRNAYCVYAKMSGDKILGVGIQEYSLDDYDVDGMVEIANWLWSCVENGTPPDPQHESEYHVVKTMFQDTSEDVIDLSDYVDLIEERANVDSQIKELTSRKLVLDAKIRLLLGPSVRGVCDKWTVRLSPPRREFTPLTERKVLEKYPHVGVMRIDRALLERDSEASAFADSVKEPVGPRSLTIYERKKRSNKKYIED